MADVDLNFLAEQYRKITVELGGVRDDLRVLQAMVIRMEHSRERHDELLADMLRENRALIQQQSCSTRLPEA